MQFKQMAWGLLLAAMTCGSAAAVTFDHVVTLGDSLLDDTTGGRSPVAAEHVAQRLGVSLTKFAQSGSTSTDMILNGQHTRAAAQFGEGDLAMLWIGGNDFFDSAFEIATGDNGFMATLESNADTAISTLRNAGMEVALFNLPDMSQVPGVIDAVHAATVLTPFLRPAAFENITQSTLAWNDRLQSLADLHEATVIDVFEIFEQLADEPSDFSILGNDPILNADTGCQFCVFFDDPLLPDVHPASFAQGYIANEAMATLNQVYDPAEVMPLQPLSIVEIALLADVYAGDFDRDDLVDGEDLVLWQNKFGSAGADADGDGDSDGADFLIWQQQFSEGMGSSAASQTVPEPATITLALGLLSAYFSQRRANR